MSLKMAGMTGLGVALGTTALISLSRYNSLKNISEPFFNAHNPVELEMAYTPEYPVRVAIRTLLKFKGVDFYKDLWWKYYDWTKIYEDLKRRRILK